MEILQLLKPTQNTCEFVTDKYKVPTFWGPDEIGLHITINHDYFAQIIVILEITFYISFFFLTLHNENFFQKLNYWNF